MKCFSLLPHTGLGDAPKGVSPSLGGGANAFFCVVSCWQNVKIFECFLEMRGFQCIGGGSAPPPPELPDARPGDAPKGTSPGLGARINAFFCGVSRLQLVKICEDLLRMRRF